MVTLSWCTMKRIPGQQNIISSQEGQFKTGRSLSSKSLLLTYWHLYKHKVETSCRPLPPPIRLG